MGVSHSNAKQGTMKLKKRATSKHHRCHDTQVPREWCNDRGAWIAVGKKGKKQLVNGT